jgi:glucose/arabinose dehydrogenase
MPRLLLAIVLLALLAGCGGDGDGADATSTRRATREATSAPTDAPAPTETATPGVVAPAGEPAAGITVPAGFAAYAIASGLSNPTSVSPGPGGEIYVSQQLGEVHRLSDSDGDGNFETDTLFGTVPTASTGLLAADDGTVYVSSTGSVTTMRDADGDGAADDAQSIISGLPNGRHQNNGMALGPDGLLYITNGSTCDDCVEANERSATILQANRDGSNLRVYARGLRNPYDIAFDAQGRLWATDNGSDEPCETIDELNLIVDGGDYGWPYGNAGCDPYADGTAPVASLGLHTASTGIAPYNASHFPAEYRGTIFATLWGSLFTAPELPPQLLYVAVDGAATAQPFASGFDSPIDVAVDRDGTLLVVDHGTGVLYRIIYAG